MATRTACGAQPGVDAPTATRAATEPTRRNPTSHHGAPPGTPPPAVISGKSSQRFGGSHRYDSDSGSPSTFSGFFLDGSDLSSASPTPSPSASLSSLFPDPSLQPQPLSLEEKLQALRLVCSGASQADAAGAPGAMDGLDPSITFTDPCFSFPALSDGHDFCTHHTSDNLYLTYRGAVGSDNLHASQRQAVVALRSPRAPINTRNQSQQLPPRIYDHGSRNSSSSVGAYPDPASLMPSESPHTVAASPAAPRLPLTPDHRHGGTSSRPNQSASGTKISALVGTESPVRPRRAHRGLQHLVVAARSGFHHDSAKNLQAGSSSPAGRRNKGYHLPFSPRGLDRAVRRGEAEQQMPRVASSSSTEVSLAVGSILTPRIASSSLSPAGGGVLMGDAAIQAQARSASARYHAVAVTSLMEGRTMSERRGDGRGESACKGGVAVAGQLEACCCDGDARGQRLLARRTTSVSPLRYSSSSGSGGGSSSSRCVMGPQEQQPTGKGPLPAARGRSGADCRPASAASSVGVIRVRGREGGALQDSFRHEALLPQASWSLIERSRDNVGAVSNVLVKPGANLAAVDAYLRMKAQRGVAVRMVMPEIHRMHGTTALPDTECQNH